MQIHWEQKNNIFCFLLAEKIYPATEGHVGEGEHYGKNYESDWSGRIYGITA